MDITIPGDDSGINTNKLIDNLLKLERKPIERLEKSIEKVKKEQQVWNTLASQMKLFNDNAKKLYRFDNAFDNRTATSSDPYIIEASTIRGAVSGEYIVYAKQLASADRWISKNIPEDYKVSGGRYTFSVGDKNISFIYDGGTIDNFISSLNQRNDKVITASLLKKGADKNSNTVLLESKVKGMSSALVLSDDAEQWAKDIGLLGYKKGNTYAVPIDTTNVINIKSNKDLFSTTQNISESNAKAVTQLMLLSGAVGTITIPQIPNIISTTDSATMHLKIRISESTDNTVIQKTNLDTAVDAILKEVIVQGNTRTSIDTISDASNNKDTYMRPLIFTENISNPLFKINTQNITDKSTVDITLPIKDIINTTNNNELQFTMINPLPQYTITIMETSLSTNKSGDRLSPIQAISRAQNAIVTFNDIDIERDSNTISDIIPGTTLTLKRASEDTVMITVGNDTEQVKEDIIRFVGAYNQLMKHITIYTVSSDNPELPQDISFSSEREREEFTNRLGILSNNNSLIRLASNLQRIVSMYYQNPINESFSTLSNIGIAPNLDITTDKIQNTTRYLDIDEDKLDIAINNHLPAVEVLFGNDINTDVQIDYGVAYSSVEAIKPYIQTNGIATQRRNTLKSKIAQDNRQIETYTRRLERYERTLKKKYGKMKELLNTLDSSTDTIKMLSQPEK